VHVIYPLLVRTLIHHPIGGNIDVVANGIGAVPPSTIIACALVLDVRNWLWHLTMNTGELKKCERHHFTDWHWAQFEQAGLLPGPVQIPSNSNYWLYTTANPGKKWGAFEFRRNLVGVGQIRLSWACFCIEQEAEYLTWKQAIERFRSDSSDYFGTRSPPAVPGSCPWIAAVEITRLADYERRWMWEFHAFYFWYLIDKMSEDGWS
jgi:hypothetical protein